MALAGRLEQKGETRAALREYERALALHEQAGTWQRLASLRARSGDWQGAASALERSLVLQPEHETANFELGRALSGSSSNSPNAPTSSCAMHA